APDAEAASTVDLPKLSVVVARFSTCVRLARRCRACGWRWPPLPRRVWRRPVMARGWRRFGGWGRWGAGGRASRRGWVGAGAPAVDWGGAPPRCGLRRWCGLHGGLVAVAVADVGWGGAGARGAGGASGAGGGAGLRAGRDRLRACDRGRGGAAGYRTRGVGG